MPVLHADLQPHKWTSVAKSYADSIHFAVVSNDDPNNFMHWIVV
jgi:hypothetical protein